MQMTITHNRTEMSDLNIRLVFEQQKVDRQTAINEQMGNQMRDLLLALKVLARACACVWYAL